MTRRNYGKVVDTMKSGTHLQKILAGSHPLLRRVVGVGAFSLVLVALMTNASSAFSSPVGNVIVITGPVSECHAGPSPGLTRPFTVALHERPSGRIVATETLSTGSRLSFYAFAVAQGTYYLTVSEKTSTPPRHDIIVNSSSKGVIRAPIPTICQ